MLPTTISRSRLISDSASAGAVATPTAAPASTNPPSCAPSAAGMANPALRAAMPRLSTMNASAGETGTPMTCRIAQVSMLPSAQAT